MDNMEGGENLGMEGGTSSSWSCYYAVREGHGFIIKSIYWKDHNERIFKMNFSKGTTERVRCSKIRGNG